MSDGERIADAKVGLFVVAALLLLVVGVLWVAGSTLTDGPSTSFTVLLKSSGGVKRGDRVHVAGVPVGRIRDVTLLPLDEWPVRIDVGVGSEITLKVDGRARVASSGLVGQPYLELLPGSLQASALEPGGQIYGDSRGGFEEALGQVTTISERVVALLDQTSGVLDEVTANITPILHKVERFVDEDNAEEFKALLTGLRGTIDEASPRLNSLLDRLDAVAGNADSSLSEIPDLTTKLGALLDDLRTALGPDGQRLAGVLEAAESGLGSADEALGVLTGSREELEITFRDLRDTIANLKSFSQTVKERPYSLVRVKPEPDRRPGDDAPGSSR